MDTTQASALFVLSLLLPFGAQWLDWRRLSEEQRRRAWNGASWGCALIAFGPLSMLGWFWVTRRGWRRFVWGPVSTGLVTAAMALCGVAVTAVTHGLALMNPPLKPQIADAVQGGLLIGLGSLLVPPLVWLLQRIGQWLRRARPVPLGQGASDDVDTDVFR